MRVLAVGNMYPPHHLGGYELVWASAMSHLRARGHDVRVLTTDFRTAASDESSEESSEELAVFRELRWYWRDHDWPRLGVRDRACLERHNQTVLERHLADFGPQAVSWWAMGGMSLGLIERVRRLGLPAIGFVHDDWLAYAPSVDQWIQAFARRPRIGALAEWVTGLPTRVELDRAARYVFVSETVRGHARAAGLRLPGSSIAHSGVAPVFFREAPEPPWSWRLLYVGRMDERKGVRDAVSALGELPDEASLTLVGEGDRRELRRLRERAAKLGVENRIHELGMRDSAELAGIYAEADVLLFPVRWEEPWGLVPLEAMAAGCPVIATGGGGSAEYLRHQANALLVKPGSPAAIATAVKRLAADQALRRRLRAGGRATAAAHTQDGFNQVVLQELEELISSTATSAHAT